MTSIGWGLICVLCAAVVAMLISLTRVVKARVDAPRAGRETRPARSVRRYLPMGGVWGPYWGGPELSCTLAVWVWPEESV